MKKLSIGAACAIAALAGCKDEAPKADAAAKDEAPAAKQAGNDGPTKEAAADEAKKPDEAPAEAKGGIVDGLPGPVAGKLKLPEARETLKGSLDLFSFEVAKGMTWGPERMGSPTKSWRELSGGDLTMSLLDHNPSGDSGPGCPSMDDMKKKVTGATTVHDLSFSTETHDDVSYGDEVKLWMFEKDGKFGFYAVKVFDHGDDATTWCAAPGKRDAAPNLATLVDRSAADQLLAIFASLKFSF